MYHVEIIYLMGELKKDRNIQTVDTSSDEAILML